MDSLNVYLNDVLVGRLIDRLRKRIAKQAPIVAGKLSARFPSGCYGLICEGIEKRSAQLEK